MIDEVKDYTRKLDFKIRFMGHAQRTADIFDNLEGGIIACMSLPTDEMRLRSLEVPMKWIHQLWVMKLACEALGIRNFLKEEYEEKPRW